MSKSASLGTRVFRARSAPSGIDAGLIPPADDLAVTTGWSPPAHVEHPLSFLTACLFWAVLRAIEQGGAFAERIRPNKPRCRSRDPDVRSQTRAAALPDTSYRRTPRSPRTPGR